MNATTRTSTNAFQIFVALQCMDLLTTLVFLGKGVAEGNPLLIWALPFARQPWLGLLATKVIAACIGLYCLRTGRIAALRLANVSYCMIVGWNLIAISAAVIAR